MNLKKYDHITPSMKELHWLRIHDCIIFKIALLVYKCRCSNAPKYLMDLLKTNKPARQLRSSYNTTLQPKFYRNVLPKSASFSSAAPRIWNDLPLNFRTAGTINISKAYSRLTCLPTIMDKHKHNLKQ